MNEETKLYWEEWERLVAEAKENLTSNCPLLCDETLLYIDSYLRMLNRAYD